MLFGGLFSSPFTTHEPKRIDHRHDPHRMPSMVGGLSTVPHYTPPQAHDVAEQKRAQGDYKGADRDARRSARGLGIGLVGGLATFGATNAVDAIEDRSHQIADRKI